VALVAQVRIRLGVEALAAAAHRVHVQRFAVRQSGGGARGGADGPSVVGHTRRDVHAVHPGLADVQQAQHLPGGRLPRRHHHVFGVGDVPGRPWVVRRRPPCEAGDGLPRRSPLLRELAVLLVLLVNPATAEVAHAEPAAPLGVGPLLMLPEVRQGRGQAALARVRVRVVGVYGRRRTELVVELVGVQQAPLPGVVRRPRVAVHALGAGDDAPPLAGRRRWF